MVGHQTSPIGVCQLDRIAIARGRETVPKKVVMSLTSAVKYMAKKTTLSPEKAQNRLEQFIRYSGNLRIRLFTYGFAEPLPVAKDVVIDFLRSKIIMPQGNDEVDVSVFRAELDNHIAQFAWPTPPANLRAADGVSTKSSKKVSARSLREFVQDNIRRIKEDGERATVTKIESEWTKAGFKGHRKELRAESRRQLGGTQRRGRLPRAMRPNG